MTGTHRQSVSSSTAVWRVALLILVFVKESPVWLENREFLRNNITQALMSVYPDYSGVERRQSRDQCR